MAFRWRDDGGPSLNGSFVVLQGIHTSIGKRPYIYCDFSVGGRTPYPPLDPHMFLVFFFLFFFFCHFPIGVLGQVCYLTVLIPDICLLLEYYKGHRAS